LEGHPLEYLLKDYENSEETPPLSTKDLLNNSDFEDRDTESYHSGETEDSQKRKRVIKKLAKDIAQSAIRG